MSTAAEWKAQGNTALSAGNHEEAIKCYTNAIEMDSSQHVFFSNRSAAYLSQGDADKALEDANQCITINPKWAKGYSRKGAALHKLKEYEQAVKAYEAGLEVDPANAACLSGLDEVKALEKGAVNPFASIFGPNVGEKIASNPKIAHLAADPSFMAIMKQLQEDPNSINQHLQDPRVMQVFSELMGINMQQAPTPPSSTTEKTTPSATTPAAEPEPMDVEMTEEEKAAKKSKSDSMEAKKRGNDFYKKKQFSEAIDAYNEAIELDPLNMSFLSNRAAVRFEMADYDACIADCNEAIKVGRENRADYALVAKAYVRIGNACAKKGPEFLSEAITAYETAQVENRVRDVDLKIKKAKADLKKAAALAYIDPEKAKVAKEEGNEKFKSGDFPGAVELYSEAIKRDPSSAVYFANRAAAYTKLTSFNEAKSDCEKALELDPSYVKAYSRLGAIQCLMKEFHKAMESYQKGLDLDKDNQECKDGLQRVKYMIQQSQGGEVDKERAAHAMADPEIQAILRDPVVQSVLQDFQTNPTAAQRHMQNPDIMGKIEKLIAAGVVRTG